MPEESKLVAKVERITPPVAMADQSAKLMDTICTAVTQPDFPMEKLEKLLDLRDRIVAAEARRAFDLDFPAMQGKLPVINGTGKFGYSKDPNDKKTPYAKWEDINPVITPVLSEYGFGLSFNIEQIDEPKNPRVMIIGTLSHSGGYSKTAKVTLPIDPSGGKNQIQAYGSTLSYGKRYVAQFLVNFTVAFDRDDDDGAAGGARTITEEQAGEITRIATSAFDGFPMEPQEVHDRVAVYTGRLCQKANVQSILQLPESCYRDAIRFTNDFYTNTRARLRKEAAAKTSAPAAADAGKGGAA